MQNAALALVKPHQISLSAMDNRREMIQLIKSFCSFLLVFLQHVYLSHTGNPE